MKKVLISLLTLIFVISLVGSVNAATTGKVDLSLSKDTVKAGEEISIIVTASDLNNLNTVEYSGIAITDETGKASTEVTVKSVDAIGNDWAKMNNDGKVNFVYSGGVTTSQQVFKVTLTVGNNIKAGTYNVSIEGLTVYSASYEDDATNIGTKSVTVKVTEDPVVEEPKKDDIPEKDPVAEEPKKEDTAKKDTTKKKTNKLPQTGAESATVIAIIALGAISIASYVSYKKYKNI